MAITRRSTVVFETARELREMILSGKWQLGEYLPSQKVLAAEFEVGLSTMHEALQVLISAGLITSHPGKGTWVSDQAINTLVQSEAVKTRLGAMSFCALRDARSVIEVALAELAAQRATPEDIERIWAAVEAMDRGDPANDGEFYASNDLEFHLAVARAGHNELLEEFYHVAYKLFTEFLAELTTLPGIDVLLFCEHNRMQAQAIQARDPIKSRQVAEKIIEDADHVLDLLICQSMAPMPCSGDGRNNDE